MEKWTQGWLAYRPVKEAGNAQLAGSMKLTGFATGNIRSYKMPFQSFAGE